MIRFKAIRSNYLVHGKCRLQPLEHKEEEAREEPRKKREWQTYENISWR